MKNNDIYNLYNDIDDMIKSIEINKEDIVKDKDEPVIIIDENAEKNNLDDNIEIIDIDIDITDDNTKVDNNDDDISKLDEIDEIFNDKIEKNEIVEYIKESKPKKEKKKKIKKSSKKWVVIFGILDSIAIICLFLMYGPISYFRNLWVTSAMTTMSHKYLAYIFFNEKTVNNIMDNNTVIENGNETNQEEINIDGADNGVYSSIYEEQVLKRENGNDLYKVLEIEGKGYKGHMLVIYDPSRVSLYQTPNSVNGGRQMPKMLKESEAIAAINASGFSISGHALIPAGSVIIDGKIKSDGGSTGWGGGIIGITYDNTLILTKKTAKEAINMGVRDGMSFGPFLIVNGERSQFKGNGGYGIAPRTAIGQRKDGIILFLVIDGRRPGHSLGVDMVELTNILENYGAYNASNLDGGGSSSFAVNGEVLSVAGGSGYSGERFLPNAWILK